MSRTFISKGFETYSYGAVSRIALIGSSFIGYITYAKQTLSMNYYKKHIELQGNSGPIEPNEKLKSMVEEVSSDMKGILYNNVPITPIMVPGLNIFHAGTIGTYAGGIIGLPRFFQFTNKDDIDRTVFVMKTDPDKPQNDVKDPYECFLLSDAAKKYAIARELFLIHTVKVYFDLCLPTAVAYIIDSLARRLQPSIEHLHPVLKRHFLSPILLLCVVALWASIHSNINRYYESEAESAITKFGDEYIKGGVEYCSKAMERQSFTVLLDEEKLNIVKFIDDTIRSILSFEEFPLSLRKAYLEAHLKLHVKENK